MPDADPFTATCPNCGTRFDLTKSVVSLEYDGFDTVTAVCPVCRGPVPVRDEEPQRPRGSASRR
jgi:endogenous inhibitor of DNA gyrase (YacG/DUF329 family)